MVRVMGMQSSEFWGDVLKESSDGETLIAVGILWFQICGAAEEKAIKTKWKYQPQKMQDRD